MSNEISLRETERKVFKSSFQDGLTDVGIGCVILMFPIALLLGPYLGDFWSPVVLLPFSWMVIFGLRLIRKFVVSPRVGIVKYGSWRISRTKRLNVLILFTLIFAAVLGFLSAVKFDVMPGWTYAARLSLVLLIGFSLAGYFLDFPRLYLYGILAALAPLIGEILYVRLDVPHHGFPVTFGITAGLMIVTGLIFFVRLLRTYPPGIDQSNYMETTE